MSGPVALVVFARTPGLSPAKTRLAATLGDQLAERIYSASLSAVFELTERVTRAAPWMDVLWSPAERVGLDHPSWHGFQLVDQGEGGLGDRIANVQNAVLERYDAVVMIGADAPFAAVEAVTDAARTLREGRADFVIGRAEDGGFWLYGARRHLSRAAWNAIRMSCPHCADDLETAVVGLGTARRVTPARDIDTEADVRALAAEPEPVSAGPALAALHKLLRDVVERRDPPRP